MKLTDDVRGTSRYDIFGLTEAFGEDWQNGAATSIPASQTTV